MTGTRSQLTLFIDENDSRIIEKIRSKFNPAQYALIKSHVTLCREDEIEQMEMVIKNLANLNCNYISIDFGPVTRFASGKGVLLPAIENYEQFQKLRELILIGTGISPERHEPHITLMHPRNSTCSDAMFEEISKEKLPRQLVFKKVSLIEQEAGAVWKVLREFYLAQCPDIR